MKENLRFLFLCRYVFFAAAFYNRNLANIQQHDKEFKIILSKRNSSSRNVLTCRAVKDKGLYRPFLEHAWSKLEEENILEKESEVPGELSSNLAVAKGMPEGTQVKITVDARAGKGSITYGRYALLETIIPDDGGMTTKGIQVLNLVLFAEPPLPVWGVDLVSLPNGKHLLAMDIQPIVVSLSDDPSEGMKDKWEEWYNTYVDGKFEWGGDLPEPTQKFFSSRALWTRLSGDDSIEMIQTSLMNAFQRHLDLYLELCNKTESSLSPNHLEEYLDYRLQNDPARPMLQSLYGKEWTEEVLQEVLFPKKRIL